jgi:hypothetical protein
VGDIEGEAGIGGRHRGTLNRRTMDRCCWCWVWGRARRLYRGCGRMAGFSGGGGGDHAATVPQRTVPSAMDKMLITNGTVRGFLFSGNLILFGNIFRQKRFSYGDVQKLWPQRSC